MIVLLILSFLARSETTGSKTLPVGTFYREQGTGSIQIKMQKNGYFFEIEASGGNGHTCSDLKGTIVDGKSSLKSAYEETPCLIAFTTENDKIIVTPEENEACRSFCGVRARFDGDYFKAQGCTQKDFKKSKKEFQALYGKKKYAEAEKLYSTLLKNCKRFMAYSEPMAYQNDLAVTYKNLGKKEDCLAVLKDWEEDYSKDESEWSDSFNLNEQSLIIKELKKMKYNSQQCQKIKN